MQNRLHLGQQFVNNAKKLSNDDIQLLIALELNEKHISVCMEEHKVKHVRNIFYLDCISI